MHASPPIDATPEVRAAARWLAARLLEYLPRGNTLDERTWRRRHRLLQWVLLLHLPALALLGLALGDSIAMIGYSLIGPVLGLVLGAVVPNRRLASFFVTGGLVFCSAALVVLTAGSIEAHFHFFILIGFIALYQDWVPFLWNVVFTVLSHGVGALWLGGLIFAHAAGQASPWLWSLIHGLGVFAACIGVIIFWRLTETQQAEKEELGRQLLTADAELGRRRFASDMLVNLARRNQSMLYRQLDIINQLEEKEQDPDALADLFALDHLATRVRRNAESLLVLAGEQPPRTWSSPVPLRDVIRAAIAETEDLDRVQFTVDDWVPPVSGRAVADVTHLLAELTENSVRFSPPDTPVTVRARMHPREADGCVLTVEDWGVGMPLADLAAANALLAKPQEVDLAVAQRLGFHVVSRLAARHGVDVTLSPTPGSGVTAALTLPASLFVPARAELSAGGRHELVVDPEESVAAPANAGWRGWWNPESAMAPGTPPSGVPAHVLAWTEPEPMAFVPSPRPRPDAPPPEAPTAVPGGLRRRVPQAHLAPELRVPAVEVTVLAPALDTAAASALSRYQASRRAAERRVDDDLARGGGA